MVRNVGSKRFFQHVLRKYGFRKVLITLPIVVSIALFGYVWIGPSTSLWYIEFWMVVMGFAASIQYSALNTIVFADVPHEQFSRATSASTVFMQIGLSLAVCFCASLLVSTGHLSHSAVLGETAFRWTYFILGISTLGSIIFFWKLSKTDGSHLWSEN